MPEGRLRPALGQGVPALLLITTQLDSIETRKPLNYRLMRSGTSRFFGAFSDFSEWPVILLHTLISRVSTRWSKRKVVYE